MPYFSHSSDNHLITCDHRIVRLFREVIKYYDCTIICGHRGRLLQEQAYRDHLSNARYGESEHNVYLSRAVDAAPYPIDWHDHQRFYHFGGFVRGIASQMKIPIRAGHDWDGDTILDDQLFMDLVHYEILQQKVS